MVDEALSRMSLSEISVAIANREVSSQEAVRNSLEQLEKRGPSLNCLARLFPEQALAEAELVDQNYPVETYAVLYTEYRSRIRICFTALAK